MHPYLTFLFIAFTVCLMVKVIVLLQWHFKQQKFASSALVFQFVLHSVHTGNLREWPKVESYIFFDFTLFPHCVLVFNT